MLKNEELQLWSNDGVVRCSTGVKAEDRTKIPSLKRKEGQVTLN